MRRYVRLVKRVLSQGDSVVEQAVTSGVWSALINVSDRSLGIAKLVVLASLLSPTAFGVIGIAHITLRSVDELSRLGFDDALIQHESAVVDEYLDTAWTVKVVRGVVIGAVVFLSAPGIASAFAEPRAEAVLQVVAVVPVLHGLRNPAVVYFRKHLAYDRYFAYFVSGTAADVCVAVAVAVTYGTVWALVAGLVAGAVVRLVGSHLLCDHRSRVRFDRERARELFGYGKWITVWSVIALLMTVGDDAFVGWYVGTAALGFYRLSYRLSNAPATEISQVFRSVLFPALSKVQSDVGRLRESYFAALRLVSVVAFPMGVGIAVVARPFVRTFLGGTWLPMVPLLQVLACYGVVLAVSSIDEPVVKAVGRPDYAVKAQALYLALVAVTVIPATEAWGVVGVAAVVTVGLVPTVVLQQYFTLGVVAGSYRRLASVLAYPLAAAVAMGVVVLGVRALGPVPAGPLGFLALVAVGVVTYAALMLAVERRFGYGMTSVAATVVDGLR